MTLYLLAFPRPQPDNHQMDALRCGLALIVYKAFRSPSASQALDPAGGAQVDDGAEPLIVGCTYHRQMPEHM